MDSRIREIENELFLHTECPIHSLLKNVPAFSDVIELYYRCKLCAEEPVHIKIESFLQHFQEYHPAYCTDTMHASELNDCKTNEVTVIISSQKPDENETGEEYVEQNTHTQSLQSQQQTMSPSEKPHDTAIAYMEPALKRMKTEFSAENECVIDNSQVSYIADTITYQDENQVSNQMGSTSVSEPQNMVNYPYDSVVVTECIETTPQNIILNTNQQKQQLVALRTSASPAQGEVISVHYTDSPQVDKVNTQMGMTNLVYTGRNNTNMIPYKMRRVLNNSMNEHMFKRTENLTTEHTDSNCGQSIIEQAMSMSHDTESFCEADMSVQSSNEEQQQVQQVKGLSSIVHITHTSQNITSANRVHSQLRQSVPGSVPQISSTQLEGASETGSVRTKSQTLQVTYGTNKSDPSPTKVLNIKNATNQVDTTFVSSSMSSLPGASNVTLEELPRRGRPPNWLSHSVMEASTSVEATDTIMHKGPLHHNQEDRIKETLVPCLNTEKNCCDYVALGAHFHCRACSGVVKEEDLVCHRYYHSSTRLICDTNVKEVVEHGEFCENVSCNTESVIHMHCKYCVVVVDTGYRFHEHLKTHHPGVWEKCQVFRESDTDTEQCLLCRAYFGTREGLTKHVTDRHFPKFCVKEMQYSVVTCCTEEFLQVEPYRIHMAVEHKTLDPVLFKPINLPLRCIDCGEEVTGKTQMKKHRWQMHSLSDTTLRTCTRCGATFANLRHLEEHWTTMHPKAALEQALPCTDCVKTFTSEAILKKHFSSVHAKKYNFHCLECVKGYYAEFQYIRHLEEMHNFEKTLLQCSGCMKKFLEENSLERHRKICLKYIHRHKLGSL